MKNGFEETYSALVHDSNSNKVGGRQVFESGFVSWEDEVVEQFERVFIGVF